MSIKKTVQKAIICLLEGRTPTEDDLGVPIYVTTSDSTHGRLFVSKDELQEIKDLTLVVELLGVRYITFTGSITESVTLSFEYISGKPTSVTFTWSRQEVDS